MRRGHDDALAAALVELLAASPVAVSRLRELVGPPSPAIATVIPPAYTVASLAAALDVSPKTVRGAIARGELEATKRGGRWIISADAVQMWAQAQDGVGHGRRPARRANGRAPLTSALTLLDAGANSASPPL